ncbi:Ig-like domain-containing protein [Anaerosporobacter sp.]|uniref:Ig-like domain-containing protein n=1 Tax=Anaerosporobacter sp. TaxID=1872529 RepID=UPI00286F8ECA|nr:Ig-like domain-containing protein [Anaerosporobacter sp.]
MKTKRTKLLSLVLAFMICLSPIFANTSTSKAADKEYVTALEDGGTAVANTEIIYDFTIDTNAKTYFDFYVPSLVNCDVSIYTSSGNLYDDFYLYTSEWYWYDDISAYYDGYYFTDFPAGDYSIKLTFDEDVAYAIDIYSEKPIATISNKTATLSVGFTKTLKVDNAGGTVTWSSSKASVASVSSKGVVTAKKAGTATITAKTPSGQKLTCKVTVKANTYKETKKTTSNLYYGSCGLQVYNASYASNGDLVLKCRFINYSGYKVTALKDLKITFKTDAGKTIGTYSVGSKSMTVAHGSSKDFTVTIKKSKLKIKKADLRNATYSYDGTYQYYRYY